MKHQIVIALESAYVARWFAEALKGYAREREVRISLLLKRPARGSKSLPGNKFLRKFISFYEDVCLTDHFETISTWPGTHVPGLDLRKAGPEGSESEMPDDVNNRVSESINRPESKRGEQIHTPELWFLHNGHLLTAGGFVGLWHFIMQFFVLSRPFVWAEKKTSSVQKCGYFQTRSFKLARNAGYLRYNIDKILNHILFQTPHGFPVCEGKEVSVNRFFKFARYLGWEFFQKFREKALAPCWHLCTIDLKDMDTNKRLKGKVFRAGAGKEWADPMVVSEGDQVFLFMEEVVSDVGHIAVVRLDKKTLEPLSGPVVVLKKDTHLSYPYVFRVESDWYMIPENSAAGEVAIYKAVDFPWKWELFRVVFQDEEWVDTTPFFHDDKWWIFSVKRPVSYASFYQELHLFSCQDILTDEWKSHPQNPVVSDVRHARPGGPLYRIGNKIYRPAQNCLNKYGGGLSICEVVTLSGEQYEEKVLGELRFPWYSKLSSFHTAAIHGNKVIGDCYF